MAFKMISKSNDLKEGDFTKRLEGQTAKIPSSAFLAVALGAMAVSAGLEVFSKRKEVANFIGLWTPTLLIMGLYNKVVKVLDHD